MFMCQPDVAFFCQAACRRIVDKLRVLQDVVDQDGRGG